MEENHRLPIAVMQWERLWRIVTHVADKWRFYYLKNKTTTTTKNQTAQLWQTSQQWCSTQDDRLDPCSRLLPLYAHRGYLPQLCICTLPTWYLSLTSTAVHISADIGQHADSRGPTAALGPGSGFLFCHWSAKLCSRAYSHHYYSTKYWKSQPEKLGKKNK